MAVFLPHSTKAWVSDAVAAMAFLVDRRLKNYLFHPLPGAVIHQRLLHRAGADQMALD